MLPKLSGALTWVLACVRLRFPGTYEAVGYIEFDICIEMLHMRFDLQEILFDQPNLLLECPDSNSHSRANPGDPELLCPPIISAPALSPQKQSSGSQEPHIRTRNWSVESGWNISTRVT